MKAFHVVMIAVLFVSTAVFARSEKRPVETSPTAKVDSVGMSKNDYISSVQRQMSDWTQRLAKMRHERSVLPTSSDRYKHLDKAVKDIEGELNDAREDLADLRGATNDKWVSYKSDVDANFRDMQRAYEKFATAE
jgi:hypothetical protein